MSLLKGPVSHCTGNKGILSSNNNIQPIIKAIIQNDSVKYCYFWAILASVIFSARWKDTSFKSIRFWAYSSHYYCISYLIFTLSLDVIYVFVTLSNVCIFIVLCKIVLKMLLFNSVLLNGFLTAFHFSLFLQRKK